MIISRRTFAKGSVAALLAGGRARAADAPRRGGTFLFNANTANILSAQVSEGLVE